MIATHKDRVLHVAYRGNNRVGRIHWHDIPQKHYRVTAVSEYLRNRVRDVVIEQQMQSRGLGTRSLAGSARESTLV